MADIHPTSIVDERAQLADDVKVGPFCMIQGDVKIGAGTILYHRVSLMGPMTIGENNRVYPGACLGYSGQDMTYDHDMDGPGTVIGDNNVFREGCTIHRASREDEITKIGNHNYFMVNSHAGHDVIVGNHCKFANSVAMAGHAIIEDQVIIGGNSAIHQFCRIGRMCMVGGMTACVQDLPPFCLVAGFKRVSALNIIGLRRAGLRDHIPNLKKTFSLYLKQGLPAPRACELILERYGDDPLCVEFVEFTKKSQTSGIMGYARKADLY